MNLITLGGGGFIGSSVHKALIKRDEKGIIISRSFCSGYQWNNTKSRTIECLTKDVDKYKMIQLFSV